MKNIINIAFIFVLLLALGSCDKECISPNQEDTTKYNDMNNFDGDEHSINNQTRGGEGNYINQNENGIVDPDDDEDESNVNGIVDPDDDEDESNSNSVVDPDDDEDESNSNGVVDPDDDEDEDEGK